MTGGNLVITFVDDFEGISIQQGKVDFHFEFAPAVTGSELKEITWAIPTASSTTRLVVKDPYTYDPMPVGFSDSLGKSVATPGFDGAVSYDPATETVTVDNNGKDITAPGALTYTLTIDVAAAGTFDLTDVLDERLAYDTGSFKATATTWTETGDSVTAPFVLGDRTFAGDGVTFSDLTVGEPTRITVTYTAHVKDEAVDDIIGLLEDGDDTENSPVQGVAEINSENGGDIFVLLGNTAETNLGDEATVDARLGTWVAPEPQPGTGTDTFNKVLKSEPETVLNPEGATDVGGDPDFSKVLPLTTTWTLTANLSAFNDTRNEWLEKWDLKQDVVLRDQLPAGLEWDKAAIEANDELTELTLAAAPADETAFRDASAPGDFYIAVDATTGVETLWINLGQDVETNWSLDVAAVLPGAAALAKLPTWGNGDPKITTAYNIANTAEYFYWDGRNVENPVPHSRTPRARNRDLYIVPDSTSTITDPASFDKNVGTVEQMTIGEAYWVPFTFDIAPGALVDLRASQIIDTVDHGVFDVTEDNLDEIAETIRGQYEGTQVTGDDFDLSLNADGELVLELADDALPGVNGDLDGRLHLEVKLPTHVVTGKTTLDITNAARVEGGTLRDYTWEASATSVATSWGSEMEVRKLVLDHETGEWTKNLRVVTDKQGNPLEGQSFIYRVELVPHGTYFDTAIFNVTDVLPAGVVPDGFVSDADVASGRVSHPTETTLTGNLRAEIKDGTMVVSQVPGTVLPESAKTNPPHVNFKVTVTDSDLNVGIVNRVRGAAPVVVTATDGYPLAIAKTDALRPTVTITDRDARFTITGPNGYVLEDVFVVEGQLMTLDDDGNEVGIVVPGLVGDADDPADVPVGDYCITEVTAPAGYKKIDAECAAVATIAADGSSEAVTIDNEPLAYFAIGDYTWIDNDRDGVQADGEPVLPGVGVELVDADDVSTVLATTTTDENGFYLFDHLPPGTYQVRFVLTDEQRDRYAFTDTLRGGDETRDSDADPATGLSEVIVLDEDNPNLKDLETYQAEDRPDGEFGALLGIDPTWDAGVVVKTYAIGDYTWIDADRDGVQDAGEAVLPGVGVSLELLDGDDVLPAVHVDGTPVAATTTGPDGHYVFDSLPAGTYRVVFTLTAEQSEQYVYTSVGATPTDVTDPAAVDSDAVVDGTDPAVARTAPIVLGDANTHLTAETGNGTVVRATEGVDPTWDAGVVERTYAIGDYTWIDRDRDGVQDDGEEPLDGVTVTLRRVGDPTTPVVDVHGREVAPAVTDEHGRYLFDELPAGEYSLTFTLDEEDAERFYFTQPDAPEAPGADDDSDAVPTTDDPSVGRVERVVLGPDSPELVPAADYEPGDVAATDGIDPTWDAGVVERSYAIGDLVWIDADRDGLQGVDADGVLVEDVLVGVTVEILDVSDPDAPRTVVDVFGEDVLPTSTDARGRYLFDNLPAGTYQVRFTLTDEQAARYTFTARDASTSDEDDSDAERGTGLTRTFTLDGTSPGLVTDAEYPFADVEATEGVDPTWDAGVVEKTYAIGDYTWVDTNRDGAQDAGEPVLPGVTVTLVDAVTEDVLGTAVTDEEGRYLFDGLPAGTYRVEFALTDEQASRYLFTTVGTGTAEDSDATPSADDAARGTTVVVTLGDDNPELTLDYDRDLTATEGVDPTWDAGVVLKRVSVGDYVWFDEDGDGTQGPDEPGIENVCLTLVGPDGEPVTDVFGNPVEGVRTDADGRYTFTDLPVLPAGQRYTVRISCVPDGYVPTTPGRGDRATDSSTDEAVSTDLTEDGQHDPTLDFGFVRVVPDPVGGDGEEPGSVPTPGDELPVTGTGAPTGFLAGAALLLLAGASLLLVRRRRLS